MKWQSIKKKTNNISVHISIKKAREGKKKQMNSLPWKETVTANKFQSWRRMKVLTLNSQEIVHVILRMNHAWCSNPFKTEQQGRANLFKKSSTSSYSALCLWKLIYLVCQCWTNMAMGWIRVLLKEEAEEKEEKQACMWHRKKKKAAKRAHENQKISVWKPPTQVKLFMTDHRSPPLLLTEVTYATFYYSMC